MTIELITRRQNRKDIESFIEIFNICVDRFGKPNYLVTWDVAFADDTDDWVAFKFWDESIATYIKLLYPALMSREEFYYRQWEQIQI